MTLACAATLIRNGRAALRPPPRLSLSQWMDREYVLSSETAAEPGRWTSLPFQVGILDAISDPFVESVSLMKSARIGYTLMMCGAIAYHVEYDPCGILVVEPTVDDAKGFSKESIAPMLRDVPCLARKRFLESEDKGPKDSSNTLMHKRFRGGVLSLTGANSGTGFRRVSRRVICLDEVDAYPQSAGSEGDPVRLATMRSQAFWNRKRIAGSTPLASGSSRIERLFEEGDQRRYHVPCTNCGHMDFLTFRREGKGDDKRQRGHWMSWPEGKPEEAHFRCRACDGRIEHKDKREIIERGEWRADAPFQGHASFHIWAAYSYSPNATWADIAKEFIAAKRGGVEALKTFVNTVLGETWVEKGEAPEWQRLYQRRETWKPGTVPAGVVVLTAGVDVQKDRLVYEVVGWGEDLQSWSIDEGVIPGDTSKPETWTAADELLGREYATAEGILFAIRFLAIDSGYNTQDVYAWARRHVGRVLACKGSATAAALLGPPKAVDVRHNGKRYARGVKVWPVGVDLAKAELYGRLGLEPPTAESGAPYPAGYCHFGQHNGEEFFKQLTAESLVRRVKQNGQIEYEWVVQPGRENHALDARNYARAAAVLCQLDRRAAAKRAAAAQPSAPAAPRQASPGSEAGPVLAATQAAPRRAGPRPSPWLGGRGGRGWLR